jgi:glycosyltransferase involved in cell wall biosynthesis
MRKILFIYFRYPLYPEGSYFQEFLNKLAEQVREIYLIATYYPPKSIFKKPTNLRIFWVPLFNIRFIGELFFIVAVLFKTIFTKELHKVDVVNSFGPRGLLAGWYLKKVYGIPLICTIEMLNEKGSIVNDIYYEIVRFLITSIPVDKFICWSNYYWEKHLKPWGIPKERVAIIPGGVDTEIYSPAFDGGNIREKYAPDCSLIVFAKPLYYPNTESAKILVRAVALLKERIKIKLLIGSGEGEREIRNLTRNLNMGDAVEFMPIVPFTEIPKYIAAADLIVLPFTYAATTSRSLLEALAMGKPVITTRVGEMPNMVENGKEALLVNPVKEEVAEAIERVLTNPDLATSLGHNAVALVNQKYALPIIINKTIETYEKVLSSVKKKIKNDFDINQGINEK